MCMADRIKERRITLGYTQEELANMLGLQKSAVAKYENGRVENIKRSTIKKMATVLECTPSYLMGFDTNVEQNGAFVAYMLMDVEFTEYAKKLFALSNEKKQRVYGYIDSLQKEIKEG